MNYAAAFAQAVSETLDRYDKSGYDAISRPDPAKVTEVKIEGEEGYNYSSYTFANPAAVLEFRGPDYYTSIDMTRVSLDLGALIQRAAELMQP